MAGLGKIQRPTVRAPRPMAHGPLTLVQRVRPEAETEGVENGVLRCVALLDRVALNVALGVCLTRTPYDLVI